MESPGPTFQNGQRRYRRDRGRRWLVPASVGSSGVRRSAVGLLLGPLVTHDWHAADRVHREGIVGWRGHDRSECLPYPTSRLVLRLLPSSPRSPCIPVPEEMSPYRSTAPSAASQPVTLGSRGARKVVVSARQTRPPSAVVAIAAAARAGYQAIRRSDATNLPVGRSGATKGQ